MECQLYKYNQDFMIDVIWFFFTRNYQRWFISRTSGKNDFDDFIIHIEIGVGSFQTTRRDASRHSSA